jgi:hypothetical protein
LPLALVAAGCVDVAAERRAHLQALIGQNELAVVQTLGVPSSSYSVGDRKFLAYDRSRLEALPGFGGFGPWGGWYDGWYGSIPPELVQYDCSTTLELAADRVVSFTERGNGCG